ncbi:MAG: gephyrin-like molybdotransferase receptor GlpR [Rhodococcus sp. (in: high G+C Gram-positive bacteria)]
MPNSIIWIGLVVIWLFVLLPMMMSKRPRIMQTSDVALATRVLHRGGSKRTARGPAAGHASDPDWRPEYDERVSAPARVVFGRTAPSTDAEDPMDTHASAEIDTDSRDADDERDRDYVPNRRGRGGFDPEADAIARAARYSFRQRAVLGLVFAAITSAALAVIVTGVLWWVCGLSVVAMGAYLYYLRRQVQIEEEIRRRRMTRMGRSRLGVESRTDDELKLVPQRLRRPGAVVLEIDDEDPEFDHLDHYDEPFQQQAPVSENIRRASGA